MFGFGILNNLLRSLTVLTWTPPLIDIAVCDTVFPPAPAPAPLPEPLLTEPEPLMIYAALTPPRKSV